MRLIDLIPLEYRLAASAALLSFLLGTVATATWQVQDWRHGERFEQQRREHAERLLALAEVRAEAGRVELHERLSLEHRLQLSEQTHYRALKDAQINQARLRDRLATADLRLSVLLATPGLGGATVSGSANAGRLVHGTLRAELDTAHARRIIDITDDGDQGLIALAACQAFVREVTAPR